MSFRPSCRFLRRWLAAVALFAVGFGVAAQAPPVPLLWKVDAPATDGAAGNTVYLLGSFHLLRETDYPWSPEVETAFAQAGHVVFELAPRDMDAATGELVLEMGIRTDGTVLESDLPSATAQQLQRWQADNGQWMERFQIGSHLIQRMRPWLVASEIALVESHKAGLNPALGLDVQLMARARAGARPLPDWKRWPGRCACWRGCRWTSRWSSCNRRWQMPRWAALRLTACTRCGARAMRTK